MELKTSDDGKTIAAYSKNELLGTAHLRSWRETTGIEIFLIDIDKSLENKQTYSALLKEAEKVITTHIDFNSSYVAMFGANGDDNQKEHCKLLELNGYVKTFSTVDMKLDLNDFHPTATKTPYIIEEFNHKDAEEVFRLMMSSYIDREFIVEMNIGDEDTDEFLDDLKNEKTFCFIAKNNEGIIGFVWVNLLEQTPYIGQLSVHSDFRHQGIARTLMEKALIELQQRGEQSVWLDTSGEDVSGAKTLYSSLGFRVFKTHYRYRKVVTKP